jgi:ketosteroid isomerase-like protein
LESPSAIGAASPQQEEKEVRQFIAQFVQARNKTNIAQIVSMFSPQAVFLTPSGHATNRQNIQRLLVQEKLEFFNRKQLVVIVTSVVTQASTHATVEGTYTLDMVGS